jgi:hypothetical protein
MTTDTIAVIVREMRTALRHNDYESDWIKDWADRLAALGDVEKDAARYRLLMRKENMRSDSDFTRGVYAYLDANKHEYDDKAAWDAAIDDAMQPKEPDDE